MRYTRVYADADGESHFADVDVAWHAVDFAPPAPPMELSDFSPASRFAFLHAPVGWEGDWHPTPQRQMMIYLQGRVEGETSDGRQRVFGPGSAILVEDTTGKGHRSRVLGEEDVLIAVIQLCGEEASG